MRVTFYLLQQQSSNAVKRFVCRLTNKAWRSGMRIHIHTDNDIQCDTFDRLLWAWREESFLPHSIKKPEHSWSTPITLGFNDPGQPENNTLLINISGTIPAFYKNFSRVCEVVDRSPGPVEILRDKFRAYKADGVQPQTHDIAARAL